jgi:hypothetical protein
VHLRGDGQAAVGGETIEHDRGEGDGPVDALNDALRKALTRFYPEIADVVLTDYRVRILDPEEATAAKTRVLIESSDGHETWGTVGVSDQHHRGLLGGAGGQRGVQAVPRRGESPAKAATMTMTD